MQKNAGNNFLQPRNSFVDGNLFAGETQDYRYQSQWAQATSIGVTGHIFTKYKAIQDGDAKLFYSSFMPLIRLSEMYYIAAECEPKVSGWKQLAQPNPHSAGPARNNHYRRK